MTITLTPARAGPARQAASGLDGSFSFESVRPGEYVLSTAHDAFNASQIRFVLEPRESRHITLSLDVRRVEVVLHVAAAATPLTSTHSPSSTVLTAERLETLPASQRINLSEAIVTLAPGMIRGHDDFVHVRGHEIALNPSINGVTFWENPHAVFSSALSPEVIDTANVMTGGFSAEYGNRFGGVVDIVTKSGLVTGNRRSVGVSVGQAGRRYLATDVGGRSEHVGYFAFASGAASNRFLSPPDAQAIHDGSRVGHVFGQVDRNFGAAGSLRVVAMGDGTNIEIPITPLDLLIHPEATANQRTRQATAIISWTRATSDMAVAASSYQRWSRLQLLPAGGPLTAMASLNRELATIGGKADVTRFVGRHGLKAGLDVVSLRPEEDLSYDYTGYLGLTHLLALPHVHFPPTPIVFSARETGRQFSAYAQDAVRMGGRLTADIASVWIGMTLSCRLCT